MAGLCEIEMVQSSPKHPKRVCGCGVCGVVSGESGGCASEVKWLFKILRMSSISTKCEMIFLKKLGKAQSVMNLKKFHAWWVSIQKWREIFSEEGNFTRGGKVRRSDGRGDVNFGFICRVASSKLSLTQLCVKVMSRACKEEKSHPPTHPLFLSI